MSKLNEAEVFKKTVEKIASDVIRRETASCLRVYKAKVITAPSGSTCSVQITGDSSILSLPYSSKVANVSAGAVVWVAVLFNDLRNGIVWETANFR